MSETENISSDIDLSQSESAFDLLMSVPQSSQTTKRQLSGRHSENLIHEYFEYNAELDKSKCTISNCKVELKGKNATNLVNHLRRLHKNEFEIYNQNETNKEKETKERIINFATTNHILFINYSKCEKV